MRTIALEEHFTPPQFQTSGLKLPGGGLGAYLAAVNQKLADVGPSRLADMDAAGIDLQVLSVPGFGLERLAPTAGIALARDCNDALGDVVQARPDRFAGFAILPLQDPDAAAAELERSVTRLGLKGAMVSGTINGRFLDDPSFSPVLAEAERLGVPIYLHPAPPPQAVFEAYFGGLPEGTAGALATGGWGWHAETGLHSLRLIVAGVFDRYPALQIIIGHLGENIPFSLARADERLTPAAPHLQRRVADYFQANFQITTSGYFTLPPLLCSLLVVGADRIMFAVDYPYSPNADGRAFLDRLPLNQADREKIAHGNAERLLRL